MCGVIVRGLNTPGYAVQGRRSPISSILFWWSSLRKRLVSQHMPAVLDSKIEFFETASEIEKEFCREPSRADAASHHSHRKSELDRLARVSRLRKSDILMFPPSRYIFVRGATGPCAICFSDSPTSVPTTSFLNSSRMPCPDSSLCSPPRTRTHDEANLHHHPPLGSLGPTQTK